MSHAYSNVRLPVLGPIMMHAVDAVHAIQAALVRRRNRLRAVAELSAMDDYLLKDIGLSRSSITAAVYYGESDTSLRQR